MNPYFFFFCDTSLYFSDSIERFMWGGCCREVEMFYHDWLFSNVGNNLALQQWKQERLDDRTDEPQQYFDDDFTRECTLDFRVKLWLCLEDVFCKDDVIILRRRPEIQVSGP